MSEENLLRVTRIRVQELFDCYSHEVPLHLDERVTIIHGPNGVGKTVLLRLTDALLGGHYARFSNVPFSLFEIELSDGSTYGVRKIRREEKNDVSAVFFLRSPDGGNSQEYEFRGDQEVITRLAARIENELPWLARYGPDQFMDRRSEEILNPLEVISKYTDVLPERMRKRGVFDEPAWMKEIQSRVSVHLIEAQRLFRFAQARDWEYTRFVPSSAAQYVETVKDYAKDLQQKISQTLATYAKVSQSLDQSFPERLLKGTVVERLAVDALKSRMQELERKRQQLKQIGLIEQDAAYPFDVSALEKTNESERSVMTLYVDDTEQKLGVLDELAQRIQLMLENINSKFNNKSIRISKDKGLTAVTGESKALELAALSSGEQHELVLLYDLLFRVKSNTLVLLDEPELSLHVNWQKSFLPELLEIVSAAHFDVLIATHSPFIVGDRSDLMTALRTE